ncbi:MAG: TRL-like family protein [Proteobacteria bacterium]|nr:TRL-like family protein [Pseudomonadota bacterium]
MLLSDYSALNCAPDSAQGLTPGMKTGEASMVNYLGLVAKGDASITAAAANGGIKTIHTVDYKYNSILGIINTTTTIVTGQ